MGQRANQRPLVDTVSVEDLICCGWVVTDVQMDMLFEPFLINLKD